MSFDEILDVTAGVFLFYNIRSTGKLCGLSLGRPTHVYVQSLLPSPKERERELANFDGNLRAVSGNTEPSARY